MGINDEWYVNIWFYLPDGEKTLLKSRNVRKEDADYINEHNLTLTAEDHNGMYILYMSNPNNDEDFVEIDNGRSCEDTIAAIVEQYKEKLG